MTGGLRDRQLADRLRTAEPVLARSLRTEFRRAANVAADRARGRILAAASHSDGSLRAAIAASVSVRAGASRSGFGAEIRSDGRRMPPGEQNLAAYANSRGRYRRWRHPVFGRDRWVSQEWPSAAGWFDDTLDEGVAEYQAAARRAMDDVRRYLGA